MASLPRLAHSCAKWRRHCVDAARLRRARLAALKLKPHGYVAGVRADGSTNRFERLHGATGGTGPWVCRCAVRHARRNAHVSSLLPLGPHLALDSHAHHLLPALDPAAGGIGELVQRPSCCRECAQPLMSHSRAVVLRFLRVDDATGGYKLVALHGSRHAAGRQPGAPVAATAGSRRSRPLRPCLLTTRTWPSRAALPSDRSSTCWASRGRRLATAAQPCAPARLHC
jgi:hypothetical protein